MESQARKKITAYRNQSPTDARIIASLPFASLEPSTEKRYISQTGDFLAFCEARKYSVVPCSLHAVSAYLYHKFCEGCTARSNSGILTRLRWYYKNILRVDWLNPADSDTLAAVQVSLLKFDSTTIKKAAPLYLTHLELIFPDVTSNDADLVCFTAWMLAYATISRMGEIISDSVRGRNLNHRVDDRCYIFYHHRAPKSHKLKQNPYAVISHRNQRAAYCVLRLYFRRFNIKPDDRLFPGVSSAGFITYSKRLQLKTAVAWLQSKLSSKGVPAVHRYTGHSPRRGAYNDHKLKTPSSILQAQGHWSAGSETASQEYAVYSLSDRLRYF